MSLFSQASFTNAQNLDTEALSPKNPLPSPYQRDLAAQQVGVLSTSRIMGLFSPGL